MAITDNMGDASTKRLNELMEELVKRGMVSKDDAPSTQPVVPPSAPIPATVQPGMRLQAAPALPQPKERPVDGRSRGRAHKETLRELKDVLLSGTERKLTNIAKAEHETSSKVGQLSWYFDTPEGREALASKPPKEQEKIRRRARMAAQDAMALDMAKGRGIAEHTSRMRRVQGHEQEKELGAGRTELAKSQRDLVEENLLRKGYDREFAKKHSKTLDADCPTCAYDGIKVPLARDFEGTSYKCTNPEHGGSFVPNDPTAKTVSWKSVKQANTGSKSDVKAGKGLSAGAMKPRLLRTDR